MSVESIILIAACAGLIMLPPRFDPAVRLKAWVLAKKKDGHS